jgi:hypothetical protein
MCSIYQRQAIGERDMPAHAKAQNRTYLPVGRALATAQPCWEDVEPPEDTPGAALVSEPRIFGGEYRQRGPKRVRSGSPLPAGSRAAQAGDRAQRRTHSAHATCFPGGRLRSASRRCFRPGRLIPNCLTCRYCPSLEHEGVSASTVNRRIPPQVRLHPMPSTRGCRAVLLDHAARSQARPGGVAWPL